MADSKQRAYMISELVRDTLTSYMVMGEDTEDKEGKREGMVG